MTTSESKRNHKSVYTVIDRLKLKEDRDYVMARLDRIPTRLWVETIQKYIKEWKDGIDNEPMGHKKQNAGRFRANQFLLSTSERK